MISISNQSHESSHVHGLHTSSEGMAKQPRPMESPQQARFLTTARWFSALRPLTATSTLRRKSPGPKHRGMKYGEGDHGAVCHVPGFTFFQTSSIYRRRGSRFFRSLPALHARNFRKPGMSMRSISSMRQPLSSSEL